MNDNEHLRKIYEIICVGWKLYKNHYHDSPKDWAAITQEANQLSAEYDGTPEEEFANKILVEVLSQMDRDRKAEEEKD